MGSWRKKKCKCCHRWFIPSSRNRHRQEFCSAPDCKKASHCQASRKCRKKPQYNTAEFRASEVKRVTAYHRKHGRGSKNVEKNKPLRDFVPAQNEISFEMLRDLLILLVTFNKGLATQVNGSLRDFDCDFVTRMYDCGAKAPSTVLDDALSRVFNHTSGENYDSQNVACAGTGPPCSEPIQLGGSPPGS